MKETWNDLISRRIDRRTLIISAFGAPALLGSGCRTSSGGHNPFRPIAATDADDLVLPAGYRYEVVASWGDDLGNGRFGIENDFVAFFPIDLPEHRLDLTRPHHGFNPRGSSSTEGLLFVNHETPLSMFGSRWDGKSPKSPEQLRVEQELVGISVVRVARQGERWKISPDQRLNRRYDARSRMLMTGPAASLDGGPEVIGTMANCSGGVTPWGTALSCEENFHEYSPAVPNGYGWGDEPYARRHYGWVVEVDPFDPGAVPRKHTALGRMRHENAAIRVAEDSTVVVYMGDDKIGSCLYKFIAERKLSADQAANRRILEKGELFVADFVNGRWLLLDRDRSSVLASEFASQAELLADVRKAGLTAGGTPLDRPEDVEVDPADGSVYVALTNNEERGNLHGHIVRLVESGSLPTAMAFDWEIFALGGPRSGFSSPDNLVFDDAGDLWMCTDVSGSTLRRRSHSFHGNNSLFRMPTRGPDRGTAYRFASGPRGCEMTGPAWTPDSSTLFLAIQHPGADSPSLERLTSHWPDGGEAIPRGSVVAITGFKPSPGRPSTSGF